MKTFQLFILILSFGAAVNGSLAADAQTTAKPNIVLFLVDDMGWMDSTPYGSQYYETPNMERLERQSMRFANAYARRLVRQS